jgi:cystathionine gamma-synthase
MQAHEGNAKKVAAFLRTYSKVEKVFYTGFDDHPQHAISAKQARGNSGMISFYLKNACNAKTILSNVKLILFAESLGGVESLITYPLVQTHAAIPEPMRIAAGVNDKLLRLSVGIENADDIIDDLKQALDACV